MMQVMAWLARRYRKMTMEWNNRNDRFDLNGGNGRGSFKEHNEWIRMFHRSHANVAIVNAPRLDESALLESMEPLQVRCTMMETGGSRLLNGVTDWSALVPIWKVAPYRLSQN